MEIKKEGWNWTILKNNKNLTIEKPFYLMVSQTLSCVSIGAWFPVWKKKVQYTKFFTKFSFFDFDLIIKIKDWLDSLVAENYRQLQFGFTVCLLLSVGPSFFFFFEKVQQIKSLNCIISESFRDKKKYKRHRRALTGPGIELCRRWVALQCWVAFRATITTSPPSRSFLFTLPWRH